MNDAKFISLDNVKARKVDWLWHPYIARNCLSIFEGDPDIGKSYLAMHLAAMVTIGGELPSGTRVRRGRVLYVTAEDDASITVRPRIEAMGGNLKRIRVLEGFLNFSDEGLEILEKEMLTHPADLVIFDTLYSFLPDGVDLGKPSAMRERLHALEQVFKPHDCAIMLIRHWTKGGKGKAIYRGGGLIDIIGVARTAMAVAKHPENPELRVLAQVKNNIGPKGESLIFCLKSYNDTLPVVEWRGTTDLTADDLEGAVGKPEKAVDSATEFLLKQLKDGPKLQSKIMETAHRYSIAPRTLDRAKAEIGVKSKKLKEGWCWSLPLSK